jgi:hypothetical protein
MAGRCDLDRRLVKMGIRNLLTAEVLKRQETVSQGDLS